MPSNNSDEYIFLKKFSALSSKWLSAGGLPPITSPSDFRKRAHRVYYQINKSIKRDYIFKDKVFFNSLIKGVGGSGPEDIALVNCEKAVVFNAQQVVGLEEFLLSLEGSYFCKERAGKGGDGAFLIVARNNEIKKNGQILSINEWSEVFKGKAYLIQRQLRQIASLDSLNPSSINTLRVITLFGKNDRVARTFSASLRVGRKSRIVDNAAAGGLFAEVNASRGTLTSKFYAKGNLSYLKHPDSGVICDGFKIPGFRDACRMCEFVHQAIGIPILTIGWDIALTDNGPVIVEANTYWDPTLHRRSDFIWRLSKEVMKAPYAYLWK